MSRRARYAGEVVVEDVFGDPRGGVQRRVEDVAGRRIDQADREVGFGDLLGDGAGGDDEHLLGDPLGLGR